MENTFLTLKKRDWVKGLIMAVGSPIVPIIMQSLNAGSFVFDWRTIGTTAAGAFVMYMAKNLFTDDVKEAEKIIEGAKK